MDLKIAKVIKKLQIDQYFPDLDINLIYLAFMPVDERYYSGVVYDTLEALHPYGVDLSYETLEFYGDQVLYMLTMEVFREFNGTRNTTHYMHLLKSKFNTNVYFRGLSHDLKICDTIYGIDRNATMTKHNKCSDSFEALFGALYMQYGLKGLERIKEWFYKIFPQTVAGIRRELAPYIYIPVKIGINDEDTIARFEILNPRCKIVQRGTQQAMYIDGELYDNQPSIDRLIPIVRSNGTLAKRWLDKRYTPHLYNDERYICTKPPLKYRCDPTLVKRVNMYNVKVPSCQWPATGPCQLLTR